MSMKKVHLLPKRKRLAESEKNPAPRFCGWNWKKSISEMKNRASASGETRLALERERLLNGEKPKFLFSDRQQRAAAYLLAGFFVMMLALTVLSRVAVSLTIAEVSTETARAGVLTQRYSIPGAVEAQDTLDVVLPGNLRISGMMVRVGDLVKAGDSLLKLDMDVLQAAMKQLENDIRVIDMKIANLSMGISNAGTEQIQRAESNLKYAQKDYQRLLTSLEAPSASNVSSSRAAEDLNEAQIRYNEALAALESAKVNAKEQLLSSARKALNDAEYNRSEALASAQAAVDSAESAENAADVAYNSAVKALTRARDQLEQARNELRLIQAQEEPPALPEEIAAAEAAVVAAEDQVYNAQAQVDAAAVSTSGGDVSHAHEDYRRVRDRHDQLVKEAEAALREAQRKTDMSDDPLVAAAQAVVDTAQAGLKSAERSYEDAGLSRDEQMATAQKAIETAQRAVESAEAELEFARKQAEQARQSDAVARRRQNDMEKLQYSAERNQKQHALDQLKELYGQDGMITAPTEGTVRMILEAGVTLENAAVITLSRADQNFQFAAKTEQAIAEQLAAGDAAELFFTSGGTKKSLKVPISSVGTPDDDGLVRITAQLTESGFPDGSAGTLEIEKNSDRYQSILPVSALRVIEGKTVCWLSEKCNLSWAQSRPWMKKPLL